MENSFKASLKVADLKEAIKKARRVRPIQSSLPILRMGFLLEFSQGQAKLICSDLEKAIIITLPCICDGAFPLVLPFNETEGFLQGGGKDDTLTIERKDKTSKYINLTRDTIGTMRLYSNFSAEEYPPVPLISDKDKVINWKASSGKWLCQMLNMLYPAVDTSSVRPVLTGVSVSDGYLSAADGFRLVHLTEKTKLAFGLGESKLIIPGETIRIMTSLFNKSDTIDFSFIDSEKHTHFSDKMVHDRVIIESGNIKLISQTIQGTYPMVDQLLPKSSNARYTFSAPVMVQRLNMIRTNDTYSIVKMLFSVPEKSPGLCTLSKNNPEDVDYEFNMPASYMAGDKSITAKIAFNRKYLLDMLKCFTVCNINIINESSPGLFTGDIEGLQIVVMPMFVSW